MSKRLYMQGYKQPKRTKRREYFNHRIRHELKKGIVNALSHRIEYEMLHGDGAWERDHPAIASE